MAAADWKRNYELKWVFNSVTEISFPEQQVNTLALVCISFMLIKCPKKYTFFSLGIQITLKDESKSMQSATSNKNFNL